MTRYSATLQHHSIGQSAEYDLADDLEEAKRIANDQLGDGFVDHVIIIADRTIPAGLEDPRVASRRIGDDPGGWTNY